ncbi:MAG: type II toxin-antitoxin system Phd/YefM family antitoxin [Sphingomonadales bacterium]|nr:type II toxin-antitoxin system Phd/YefM family antitoxin [Sphingomonadales bacterium]
MPLSFEHGDAELPASPAIPCEVPVKEAKAKLAELLRRVEAGERIVLTRHGKPVADLVPHGAASGERKQSFWERYQAWCDENPSLGIGWVSPDFDDPLPEDFLLRPLPDDFDDKLAEHNRRIEEARRKRDELSE